jgi:hypothetical protein
MHLQLYATNCYLQLALIVSTTILHLSSFLQLCYNAFVATKKKKIPTIVIITQHIIGIPTSQVET